MEDDNEHRRPSTTELVEKIHSLKKDRVRLTAQMRQLADRMKELDIQLRAYEDAATIVFGGSQYQALIGALEGTVVARSNATGTLTALTPELLEGAWKKKNLSWPWAKILASMSEHSSFGYDDLESMSDIMGFEISKPGLRSQMKTYVDEQLVERIARKRGQFRVTDLGRVAADQTLQKSASHPGAAEAFADEDQLEDDLDDAASGTKGGVFE